MLPITLQTTSDLETLRESCELKCKLAAGQDGKVSLNLLTNESARTLEIDAIGGWKRGRETKREGLTKAGLLMFGSHRSIREVFPNFFLVCRKIKSDGLRVWPWLLRLAATSLNHNPLR